MTSETIICPIDLSEDSYIALAVASWFAKDLDARLHVLHVRRPDFPGGADASYREDDWFAELVREAVTRFGADDVSVHSAVAVGDVADEITRLARDVGADLIVMAGHNKKGWERVRDGSVADEVASRVRCPVIVLRMASSGWQAYDCLTETYISLN